LHYDGILLQFDRTRLCYWWEMT